MLKAGVYGGSGLRVRPGWGEEALYQGGPALDALEPVNELPGELAGVGGGQVAQTVFHVRPGALRGVEIGGVSVPAVRVPGQDDVGSRLTAVASAIAPAVAGLSGGLQDVGMPGDVSAGTGPGPGARPELQASHEDRDRAVEILRVAAGDGRLTAAELDKRVEAALTARTSGELAALTADLPAVPGQVGSGAAQARGVVRLDYQGGNATRRGRWVVPARMEIRAVGGTVKLDFTDAVITQPTLQIQAYVRGGGLVLVTKPGIEVDTDGITVRGGTVRIRPRNGWKEPVRLAVEIRARTGAGASPLAHRAGCSGNRCVGPDRTPGHSATDTLGTKTCCPDGQAVQAPQPRRLPSMRGLSSAGIDDDIGAERRISHFKRHAVPITARDGEMVALRPPIA